MQPDPAVAAKHPPAKGSRLAATAAVLVVVALGLVAVVGWFDPFAPPRPTDTAGQGTVAIGGPFTLVDQDGRTVSDTDLRGRYLLIYFGYAYCPDICPTSLARNAAALDLLGRQGESVVPILITVDPQRDTPELLKTYAEAFHPRLVALTGTPEQVAAAAKAYRVYYAKVDEGRGPDAYLIDHSGFTYLMGPDGRFLQFYRHDLSAEVLAERLRSAL
jgi:protein SCO1/2